MSASANIQKHVRSEQGHTEYFIKVFYNGLEWGIWKRFRDFVVFDKYLRKSGVEVSYNLPDKRWWGKYDPELLDNRLRELQVYLDVLLTSTVSTGHSLVKEFLEVDSNMLCSAKRLSLSERSIHERIRRIVNQTKVQLFQIPTALSQNEKDEMTMKKKSFTISRGTSLTPMSPMNPSSFKKIQDSSSKEANLSTANNELTNKSSLALTHFERDSSGSSTQSRLYSYDLMRSLSLTSQFYLSGNSNTNNANDALSAAIDNGGVISAFIKHAETAYDSNITTITDITSNIESDTLPLTMCNESDAIAQLSCVPFDTLNVMKNIMNEQVDCILQASTKNTLLLNYSDMIYHLKSVTLTERKNSTMRNYGNKKNTSISSDENDERRPKADLRLRKTPSELRK